MIYPFPYPSSLQLPFSAGVPLDPLPVGKFPEETLAHMRQKYLGWIHQNDFSNDDMNEIFELESFLCLQLGTFTLTKEDYEQLFQIYSRWAYPLLIRIKASLVNRAAHSIFVEAARKGIAFQAGMRAIVWSFVSQPYPFIRHNTSSAQEVCLLPEAGAVFKELTVEAENEEKLIYDLFAFKAPGMIVPSLRFKNLEWSRLGLPLVTPHQISTHYTARETIHNPTLENSLLAKVDATSRQIYLQWKAFHSRNVDNGPVFIPQFNDPDGQHCYEYCEGVLWQYQADSFTQSQRGTFKRIQTLVFSNIPFSVSPVSYGTRRAPKEALDILTVALNSVQWRIITPQPYKVFSDFLTRQLEPFEDVFAKPYVHMRTLSQLRQNPPLLEAILSRLDLKQAQLCAVYSGVFQMGDLHGSNIGYAPSIEEELYEMLPKEISYIGEMLTFESLQTAYLTGRVRDDSLLWFNVSENGYSYFKPGTIAQWRELHYALNSHWSMQLFDGDISLSEDNYLLQQDEEHGELKWKLDFKNVKRGETVRLSLLHTRTALLGLPWKHLPLDPEVIHHLENDNSADMWKWIMREDTPIRRRIPKHVQNQLNHCLNTILQKADYQICILGGCVSKKDSETLRQQFANELALASTPECQEVWRLIDFYLQHLIIKQGDTYQKIAKRYGHNVFHLQGLNANKVLIVGESLQLPHPCWNMSEGEKFKWHYHTALQLFPMMTWKQRKALQEREESIRNYLAHYRSIKEVPDDFETLFQGMKKFYEMNIYSWSNYQSMLKWVEANSDNLEVGGDKLQELRKKIETDCQPTYFNVMKAMYPLLADTIELADLCLDVFNEDGLGYYDHPVPIEAMIQSIPLVYPEDDPVHEVCRNLQERLNNIKQQLIAENPEPNVFIPEYSGINSNSSGSSQATPSLSLSSSATQPSFRSRGSVETSAG